MGEREKQYKGSISYQKLRDLMNEKNVKKKRTQRKI